jgi:hypothetical protein
MILAWALAFCASGPVWGSAAGASMEANVPDPKWEPITQKDKEQGRRVNLEYKWQGVSCGYPALIPPAYFRGEKPKGGFPLIVELGGGDGGFGHPLDKIGIESEEHGPKHGYFVAVPIADSNWGFNRHVERVVLSAIGDMCARFPIDEQNVFLVGYSNGANGTYQMLFLFPERFAGAATSSGAMKSRWADRIRKVPLIIFHHERDAIIHVEYDRELVAEMRRLGSKDGVDFVYREEPGEGHVTMPYMNEETVIWFDHCRRPRQRDEVKDLEWSLSQFPWFRRIIPLKPKSEQERKVAEKIVNMLNSSDYSQAEEAYREAMECKLQPGDTWYALGIMLYDLKQYPKSVVAFKEAIRAFYENPRDYRVATAYLWIGRDLDLWGRREEAVGWYTKARDTGNPIEVRHDQYGIVGSAKDLGEVGIREPFQRVSRVPPPTPSP